MLVQKNALALTRAFFFISIYGLLIFFATKVNQGEVYVTFRIFF